MTKLRNWLGLKDKVLCSRPTLPSASFPRALGASSLGWGPSERDVSLPLDGRGPCGEEECTGLGLCP